jgi:hypothetical protein
MVNRGRPAADCSFFLGSSVAPELRKEHLQDLLKFYHLNLTKGLIKFGYKEDMYTIGDFKKDFEECFVFGLGFGVVLAQVTKQGVMFMPLDNKSLIVFQFTMNNVDAMQKEFGLVEGEAETKEDMMKQMEQQRKAQKQENRTNEKLTNRLCYLAEEGNTYGYFD